MRYDLLDHTREDKRAWAIHTAHAVNIQWSGAMRPSEIYWTKASSLSKLNTKEPVALTLQCFSPHLRLRNMLTPDAMVLAASLRAQKNNSPQCGVSFSQTDDAYCAVKSIFYMHGVSTVTQFQYLADQFPKRPLIPQRRDPTKFVNTCDIARNTRKLLSEMPKYHPELVKRIKGHSPRLGYATWAIAAGIPETIIAKKLRWKTEEVRKVYMAPGPEAQLVTIRQILAKYGETDEAQHSIDWCWLARSLMVILNITIALRPRALGVKLAV